MGHIARLAQVQGARFGLIQPRIYAHAGTATVPEGFRDVIEGNNGAYAAAPGWDACTGLGVPVGSGLAIALAARAGRRGQSGSQSGSRSGSRSGDQPG